MIKKLVLFLLISASAFGQAAGLMPVPHYQFFGATGQPLAGGKLYTYSAGTTTPAPTYADSSAGVQNSNPIILDAGGYATIWLGPQSYNIVLKNSAGVLQWSVDNVSNLGLLVSAKLGTLTPRGFIYTDTSSVIQSTATVTNGDLLIGSTGAIPVKAKITATTGQSIGVTNGAGSIAIANPYHLAGAADPTNPCTPLGALYSRTTGGTGNSQFSCEGGALAPILRYRVETITACLPSGGHNPCTNAGEQLNQCRFQLPSGGGICDATGFGNTPQVITDTVLIGDTTKSEVVVVTTANIFFINYVNALKDTIVVYSSSGISGIGPAQGKEQSTFTLCGNGSPSPCSGTAAAVHSVITNQDHVAQTRHIILSNFAIGNQAFFGHTGATCVHGLNFEGLTDLATISGVTVGQLPCIGMRIANSTGGSGSGPILIDNISLNGVGIAGSRPLVIECQDTTGFLSGINFSAATIVNAGAGQYGVEINVHNVGNGSCISGIHFTQLYGEILPAHNNSYMLIKDAQGVTIDGMVTSSSGAIDVVDTIKIDETAPGGTNALISIKNFRTFVPATNHFINDLPLTKFADNFYIPLYQTNDLSDAIGMEGVKPNAGTYFPNYTLTPVTFAQLVGMSPSGIHAQDFTHIDCSDCKNVAVDAAVAGAICVGGGTGASAVIRADVWYCN